MKRLVSLLVSMTVAAAAAAQHIPEECLRACDSLGDGCRQALVVLAGEGYDCDIFFMRRDGQWRCMSQVRGATGRSGVIDARLKREGDGATPAGVYPLRRGLWREADVGTLFPMEIYDERYLWVDDPESELYNTLLRDAGDQWSGRGERLSQVGEPYRYIVVVEYNTDPVAGGAGSAIFVHAWRAEGRPTAGCVAMPADDMRRLVEWLDPSLRPHIVITRYDDNVKTYNHVQ